MVGGAGGGGNGGLEGCVNGRLHSLNGLEGVNGPEGVNARFLCYILIIHYLCLFICNHRGLDSAQHAAQ